MSVAPRHKASKAKAMSAEMGALLWCWQCHVLLVNLMGGETTNLSEKVNSAQRFDGRLS